MSDLESRPPTIEDLVKLCRALNKEGAKYIVIGGMAVLQHGFVRGTEDIDLLVESSTTNEKKIYNGMMVLADQAVKELKLGDLDEYEVIRVNDEITVDLMKFASGLSYQDASDSIKFINIKGESIPFASEELLLKMKQSVREKDVLDRRFLELRLKNKFKN